MSLLSTPFDHLVLENLGRGVTQVSLNRPEKLNALHDGLWSELELLSTVVPTDPAVRALVLTGAGRGFCAGADLEVINGLPDASVRDFLTVQEKGARVIAAVKRIPVPVVAAVNGPATGGGLALALAADVRLAVPSARFNVAFVRLGLSGCDVGVSWLLPRVVGLGHASELMLTGRLIDANEAFRIGLVNRVVEPDDLLVSAGDLAFEMVRNSPLGLQLTKEALQLNIDAPSIEAAIALENRNQLIASRSEDAPIAMRAFADRIAAPEFTGR